MVEYLNFIVLDVLKFVLVVVSHDCEFGANNGVPFNMLAANDYLIYSWISH